MYLGRERSRTGVSRWILSGLLNNDINVFEDLARRDAYETFRRLDKVVARNSAVLAAERIDEDERFGKLFGANQETGAVNVPILR